MINKRDIYIFGCGDNGKQLLCLLEAIDIKIAAFIDNDKEKQNQDVKGYACISLEEAVERGAKSSILLVSPHQCEKIMEQLKQQGFIYYFDVHKLAEKCKYFIPKKFSREDYQYVVPFNHYESPYPDIESIHQKEEILFSNKDIKDISFNEKRQLELLNSMKSIKAPVWNCKKSGDSRYYSDNGWFPKSSADILYYMMNILQPKTIIEAGSGFSTSVMLDVNEQVFHNQIKIISIEPFADRLKSLLKPSDNLEICELGLQEIPLEKFETLQPNDILFIDSSHVSKIDSDINYLFFEVLPRIKAGVYIHFHDIFYPFIYPKEWIYQGRAYNEAYILRAFLMNNEKYTIQWFGGFMVDKYSELLGDELSGCGNGTIWLRKE